MNLKHVVKLKPEERTQLRQMVKVGTARARTLTRARILLKADQSRGGPAWTDQAIRQALECGEATVGRVRRRYCEGGLEMAIDNRTPRRIYQRKIDGEGEAHLIAVACGEPPEGHQRWSLRLLADRMVELGHFETLSYQSVRRVLKKPNSSPGS
jgi:Homeodomain-like domain